LNLEAESLDNGDRCERSNDLKLMVKEKEGNLKQRTPKVRILHSPIPKKEPQGTTTSKQTVNQTTKQQSDILILTDPASRNTPDPLIDYNLAALAEDSRELDGMPDPRSCLYLPGKLNGRTIYMMVDTGCSGNLLSKTVFDQLPSSLKKTLRPGYSGGTMCDGTVSKFYGQINLKVKLRSVTKVITFQVTSLYLDAILGMDFLSKDAVVDIGKAVVLMDGKKLPCTDRFGRMLSAGVQIFRTTKIQPGEEVLLTCRLTNLVSGQLGLVEGGEESEIAVAACLVTPDEQKRTLPVRCYNPAAHPITLPAGKLIGTYTTIAEQQITEDGQLPMEGSQHSQMSNEKAQLELYPVPDHLKTLYTDACHACKTPEECQQVAKLLIAYGDVFSSGSDDVGRTTLVTHSIPTHPGTRPIKQPPRRLGPARDKEVETQVKQLLEKGQIEPHEGAWSSPVVLVTKKDGTWRMCVDYRKLNAVTRHDAYPLPRIDDSLDSLTGSKYFSTLDLLSGYWQVPLDEDAQEKSAFVTRGGLWKWKVLPFGLTSAPATFERLMERVLSGLQWQTLLLYLDDVIVFSQTFSQHMERLGEVLKRFRMAGLKLKPSKCELLKPRVAYLGHVVGPDGVSTDPQKVEAVKHWPIPRCQTDLRSFLGFVGYYRRFVPDFATIAKPLSVLTSKGVAFEWQNVHQEAFDKLKTAMLTAPVLAYPDPAAPYYLDTDASGDGLGAVLSQKIDGTERAIAYWSKTLSPAERNYCVTRRELLAVIEACKHFRSYLYGRQFTLRTDHASLLWLQNRKEPHHQVARWLEILAEFNYKLEHRQGKKHGNADGLSRMQCSDCRKCKTIEERDGGPTRREIETRNIEQLNEVISQESDDATPVQKLTQQVTESDVDPKSTVMLAALHTGVSGRKEAKELAEAQQCSPSDVAEVYKHVKEGKDIPEEIISQSGMELKQLAAIRNRLHIGDDGVLVADLQIGRRRRLCAVCPSHWRRDVIWNTHKLAHQGMNRTLWRLKLDWYWPGMTTDVRRQVRTCGICQAAKHGRKTKPTRRQRLYAGRPWQLVSVDLVGPFSKTKRGNTMVLVIADHFTRWRDAIPIPDGTAQTVAQALEERVFCYFGVPEQLHADQGAQFESKLMQELCATWGINKTRTTPYHPEGNGVVERGNRDLGDSLRSLLLGGEESEWDLLLPHIMRSIRASPHHTTGETANYLMFGRELRLPDQLVYGSKVPPAETREVYAVKLQERLQRVHDALRQQQQDARTRDHDSPAAFNEGDYVLMINKRLKKGQTAKLAPKYVGPYKVLQVFPNRTYQIGRDGQASIENERRLKAFHGPADPRAEAPVQLEPVRRKPMMGRPPLVRRTDHSDSQDVTMLERMQQMVKQTHQQKEETQRSQSKPPNATDTHADKVTDNPQKGSNTAQYRDALLHDHTYATHPSKEESTSRVWVMPKQSVKAEFTEEHSPNDRKLPDRKKMTPKLPPVDKKQDLQIEVLVPDGSILSKPTTVIKEDEKTVHNGSRTLRRTDQQLDDQVSGNQPPTQPLQTPIVVERVKQPSLPTITKVLPQPTDKSTLTTDDKPENSKPLHRTPQATQAGKQPLVKTKTQPSTEKVSPKLQTRIQACLKSQKSQIIGSTSKTTAGNRSSKIPVAQAAPVKSGKKKQLDPPKSNQPKPTTSGIPPQPSKIPLQQLPVSQSQPGNSTDDKGLRRSARIRQKPSFLKKNYLMSLIHHLRGRNSH
jgi:transposase InsO family protein